ncbi:hypothetical protein [Heliophilum fasciatum]|nr:hypothetical protein [Heliophilum fasciatum]MCW2279180.1 hypothetical protein [Heliophilum fasciatum]
MFQQLFNEFNDEAYRLQAKVDAMIQEKKEMIERKETWQQEYSELLLNDAPHAEVTKKKRALERVSRDIADFDERIEAVKTRRLMMLRERLPELSHVRSLEIERIVEEYKALILEARKMKAEMLMFYRKINSKKREAGITYDQMKAAAEAVGADEFKPDRTTFPMYWITNAYTGVDKTIAPLEQEIDNAFGTGAVPWWVWYYSQTGEMLWNELQAHDRCKELEKKQAEEKEAAKHE